METLRNSISFRRNFRKADSKATVDTYCEEEHTDDQEATIEEFLASAERIASSPKRIDLSLRKKKSRKESRKRSKEDIVDDSYSGDGEYSHYQSPQKRQDQHLHHSDNDKTNRPLQHDDDSTIPNVHDEMLVKAVIARDNQLNKEITELFNLDPFGEDDSEDDDCASKCWSGCMFLQ